MKPRQNFKANTEIWQQKSNFTGHENPRFWTLTLLENRDHVFFIFHYLTNNYSPSNMCQARSWAFSHILTHLILTTIPLMWILLPFISDEETNLETLTNLPSSDRPQLQLWPLPFISTCFWSPFCTAQAMCSAQHLRVHFSYCPTEPVPDTQHPGPDRIRLSIKVPWIIRLSYSSLQNKHLNRYLFPGLYYLKASYNSTVKYIFKNGNYCTEPPESYAKWQIPASQINTIIEKKYSAYSLNPVCR